VASHTLYAFARSFQPLTGVLMNLTRRHVSFACALALAGIAGTAAAQTKWDLPAAYPANNYHSENLVQFAADVDKATAGKLKITVHANASLFKAPEIKAGRHKSARSCSPTSRTNGKYSAPTACPSWPTATTRRPSCTRRKNQRWKRSSASRA
jgi:hypothetical protein